MVFEQTTKNAPPFPSWPAGVYAGNGIVPSLLQYGSLILLITREANGSGSLPGNLLGGRSQGSRYWASVSGER